MQWHGTVRLTGEDEGLIGQLAVARSGEIFLGSAKFTEHAQRVGVERDRSDARPRLRSPATMPPGTATIPSSKRTKLLSTSMSDHLRAQASHASTSGGDEAE